MSRHNLKYWRCEPYIGFGVAAHGYDGYSTRYAHGDDIEKYIFDPTPKCNCLTHKDMYNEYIMLALRTQSGIDLADFKTRFGYDFVKDNSDVLSDFERSGYVEIDQNHIRISPRYMFVMNGLIEDLMKD